MPFPDISNQSWLWTLVRDTSVWITTVTFSFACITTQVLLTSLETQTSLEKESVSSANIRSCKSIAFNSNKQSNSSVRSFTLDVQNYGWDSTHTVIKKRKIKW